MHWSCAGSNATSREQKRGRKRERKGEGPQQNRTRDDADDEYRVSIIMQSL